MYDYIYIHIHIYSPIHINHIRSNHPIAVGVLIGLPSLALPLVRSAWGNFTTITGLVEGKIETENQGRHIGKHVNKLMHQEVQTIGYPLLIHSSCHSGNVEMGTVGPPN